MASSDDFKRDAVAQITEPSVSGSLLNTMAICFDDRFGLECPRLCV